MVVKFIKKVTGEDKLYIGVHSMVLCGSLVDHTTTEINAICVFWGPHHTLYLYRQKALYSASTLPLTVILWQIIQQTKQTQTTQQLI